MRLFEIIQPTVTQYPYQDSEYSYTDLYTRDRKGTDSKPHGGYSYADDTGHDPHEITVKNMKSRRLDPKYEFYKNLQDLMGSNPYMPIVYNIDQYTQDELTRNEFRMERLTGHEAIDPGQFESAMIQFINDVGERAAGVKRLRTLLEQHDVKSAHNHATSMIKRYTLNQSPLTKSAQLYEFISRLRRVVNSRTILWDINPGNIMYRRTNTGAQMVIADPVAHNPRLD